MIKKDKRKLYKMVQYLEERKTWHQPPTPCRKRSRRLSSCLSASTKWRLVCLGPGGLHFVGPKQPKASFAKRGSFSVRPRWRWDLQGIHAGTGTSSPSSVPNTICLWQFAPPARRCIAVLQMSPLPWTQWSSTSCLICFRLWFGDFAQSFATLLV